MKSQPISNAEYRPFNPKFPIELGKAGEFAGRGYFGSGFSNSIARTAMRVRTGSARIYMVECSYCGKRFPGKRYSTRLRPHNDKFGNRCFGRSGYIAYWAVSIGLICELCFFIAHWKKPPH